ncbi:MAG: helix-turn-helix domain-containing protein [Chloroflexi bacterium]|nr:helix-turn-helix domain-containing protein [Chloroflexota bacterium]
MDELGHILREARETKGLTLAEVQDKIRINSRFLEALEIGDYAILPTSVHVRGFLRNYARFLGLDPSPLLNRYELNQTHKTKSRPVSVVTTGEPTISQDSPLKSREDQPFFEPVNMEVNAAPERNTESVMRLVMIVALLVTLYLVGSQFIPRLFNDNSNTEAATEFINSVVQRVISGEEIPEEVETDTAVPQPSGVITSTSRNIFPTPTATRPSLPATMETIELQVEILERTWMEVTIDGNILYSGLAKPSDERYAWTALEQAKINTGNAIGVFVTINGVELGRLGGRQENIEEVWNTTN